MPECSRILCNIVLFHNLQSLILSCVQRTLNAKSHNERNPATIQTAIRNAKLQERVTWKPRVSEHSEGYRESFCKHEQSPYFQKLASAAVASPDTEVQSFDCDSAWDVWKLWLVGSFIKGWPGEYWHTSQVCALVLGWAVVVAYGYFEGGILPWGQHGYTPMGGHPAYIVFIGTDILDPLIIWVC